MSEYYFAVLPQFPGTPIKGGKRAAKQRDKIAKNIDPKGDIHIILILLKNVGVVGVIV